MAQHDEDEEREIEAMREMAMRTVADFCEQYGRDVLSEPPPVEEGEEVPEAPPSPPETKRTGCGCPCAPGDAETCHSDQVSDGGMVSHGAPWGAAEDFPPRTRRPRRLAPRHIMAARMLISGRRIYEVAAHLGVNRHTVTTWLKWPEFQNEVYRMAAESMTRPEEKTP